MLDYPEFEFIRGNSIVKPTKFGTRHRKGVVAQLDVFPADILVLSEFVDIFEKF